MPTWEGLRLKAREKYRGLTSKWRSTKIINKNFSIISNNCWGGIIYQSYNLPYQSPTVGMFFMPDEYIKFLKRLDYYLRECSIKFINPYESRYVEYLSDDKRFGSYLIARLDDVEIAMLHYHNEKEAKMKWERRCKRINWKKIIVKFNDQNGCNESHINEFENLSFKNKLFFTVNKYDQYKSTIRIKSPRNHKCIMTSYEPFGKSKVFDINLYINKL